MQKDVTNYIQKHTFLITMVVVVAFVLLAFGEYFLYRKIMLVNKMVSEGLMQIKETSQTDDVMEELDLMMEDEPSNSGATGVMQKGY